MKVLTFLLVHSKALIKLFILNNFNFLFDIFTKVAKSLTVLNEKREYNVISYP